MMFVLGLRWSTQRLLRTLPLSVWLFCMLAVCAIGIVERQSAPPLAVERVLFGAVSGMTLPLIVYAAAARVFGVSRMQMGGPIVGKVSVAPSSSAARYGGDRRLWLLGAMLGTGMLLATASAALAGASVLAAGGTMGMPLFSDVRTAAVISGLGAVAYVALFAFGSTVGRSGWLRPFLLLSDWVLGGLTTAVALPFPRGHLRTLLGAEPVMSLGQGPSWAVLWGLVIAYTVLALVRTPR